MQRASEPRRGFVKRASGQGEVVERLPASGSAFRIRPIFLIRAVNVPTSTVMTGIDNMKALEQAIEAAQTFKPMSKEAVADLLARTARAAANAK